MPKDIDKILETARRKLGERIDLDVYPGESFSREYSIFRREAMDVKYTRYEHWCNKAEKLFKVKVKEKDYAKIDAAIKRCHLDMTPDGALSFAMIVGLGLIVFSLIWGIFSFVVNYNGELSFGPIILPLIVMLGGALIIKPLSKYPLRLANQWRLRASNQMVLCILYTVMYMRHTSNLEHAIKFAGEHVGFPLSLDLRKVLWNVETGKHVSVKESLDEYLAGWRDSNLEFVEAFNLIESSLYEKTESRRVSLLEKSLQVMLEGTYEKMLHYAQDLKSPITMLHMLGVILPILGLVVFPLLGSFMGGLIKWYHLAVLYNIILPVLVYYIGMNLLSKRPTGYSESEVLTAYEKRKYVSIKGGKYKIDPLFFSVLIIFVFSFIGLVPLILHFTNPGMDFEIFKGAMFLDYKSFGGPFGVGALLMSLFIPLGWALGLGYYYRARTKDLIKFKRETNKLEQQFSGAMFQLGNRVGEGIPVEIAFSKVAKNLVGTPTGRFFRIVSLNLRKLGMSVKSAIFDKEQGAILNYPSALIESSMKVLVEAAKKGPRVVAKSLITISNYVREIHRVNERLKDLLADIISSMKSQIAFLTPMIAGIVVGVSSMVVTIINQLSASFSGMEAGGAGDVTAGFGVGGLTQITEILNIKDVIPSYYFQLIVGIYLVEIVVILTLLANGIERGEDKITARYNLSKNLIISTLLYTILSFICILIFNVLASGIGSLSGL